MTAPAGEGLPEIPSLGSVYGFRFSFGSQDLLYPHPGIIVAARLGQKDGKPRCGVIALAISHATQKPDWTSAATLPVPLDELDKMGLDAAGHWVCLFEQIVAYFPEGTKWIAGASTAHLGQASEGFTRQVIAAWD